MQMLMHVRMPIEPFNDMVRNGTAGPTLQAILADIKPHATYFTSGSGQRGGIIVVDVNDPSDIPRLAEPFFLAFEADVEFEPCMSPEDLGRADLDGLGQKWG
jgi:hypothetical protein